MLQNLSDQGVPAVQAAIAPFAGEADGTQESCRCKNIKNGPGWSVVSCHICLRYLGSTSITLEVTLLVVVQAAGGSLMKGLLLCVAVPGAGKAEAPGTYAPLPVKGSTLEVAAAGRAGLRPMRFKM